MVKTVIKFILTAIGFTLFLLAGTSLITLYRLLTLLTDKTHRLVQVPALVRASEIKDTTELAQVPSYLGTVNRWVPARPLPYVSNVFSNTKTRLVLAMNVYTGKYDAVDWEDRLE